MIRFTTEKGRPVMDASLGERIGVYLDNDSLIELSKGSVARQKRFVNSLQRGGSLLFSFTNALEVAGPQGASAAAVRTFLESVGPYWIPFEINPFKVVERETLGLGHRAPVSERFMNAYFIDRTDDLSQNGGRVLDLSADSFFRLDAVMDWVQKDRVALEIRKDQIYNALLQRVTQLRANYEKDSSVLDQELPSIPFASSRPATFVLHNLLRGLVVEAKAFTLTRNDALDFCHAVPAAAYARVATLDKQWKRRVEALPEPNHLAKVYYRPQVDQLVDQLEVLVSTN